ncbi:MAG TPA: nicotinamide-nucleotide amidohydrolase family protein [Methylomirabilota bacterium]|nr:nicotinamide-nucleotide amidohydrolase family protein [Methylomirabilota bacterium]
MSSVRLIAVGAGAGGDGTAPAHATLVAAGVPVAGRLLVDDDEAALEQAVAGDGVAVVVAGPGGSAGDVVRRVIARVTGTRLVLQERMLAALQEAYRRRDRPLPRRAERLALLPQGASVWTVGEGEPAWALEAGRTVIAVLPPGAPSPELARQLVDFARAFAGARPTVTRTLRTTGASLEDIEERLAEWLGHAEDDVTVATVPADGEVWVRLRARGASAEEATTALARVEPRVAAALGDDCYGRDAETLEQVVGRLLIARGLTLSVAESCTGGLLGHRLTNVSGSSAYFERGVVVYSNRAKQELLGVPEEVLRAHGAVSAPCAEAMARGICERSGSACGLSVTGIAGPDGGTPQKPVGTVFVGVAVSGHVASKRFRFLGDRVAIKWQSAQTALDLLRRSLGGVRP